MNDTNHIASSLPLVYLSSRPIEIPKSIINIHNEQYGIKTNCFDPTQDSPPSVWKTRLNNRIGGSRIKYECSSTKKGM